MREHDAGPAMMRAQLHTALLATMVDGDVAVTKSKNSGAPAKQWENETRDCPLVSSLTGC
jgi:hypothetical protein